MAEQRLRDIEPKSNDSTPITSRADNPIWTHGDTFTFNFFPDGSPALLEKTSPSSEPTRSQISFTGQDCPFAFNFQIPSVTPVEHMETTETLDARSSGSQEEKSSLPLEVHAPPEPLGPLKGKRKKKKSGKNSSDCTEQQQNPSSCDESQGGEGAELSAEEQLNRQLDWCIEQLKQEMRFHKNTPRQKESAALALKTLQSSKAPLVKKRQVMRAMTGDYRKKMEEEKRKQHRLIQSEIASARVKVAADSSKKCVFHRRAGVKTQTSDTEENLPKAEAQNTCPTSAFIFTPSKEKFCFNFL